MHNKVEIAKLFQRLSSVIKRICILGVYRFMKTKNNKVIFSSFYGNQYSAQPKKIFEEIYKKNKNLDYVWILVDDVNAPEGVRTVKPNSLRALIELATAKVWVDNCRKHFLIKKRKDQIYIQTWHGPICIKAVEKDAQTTLPHGYIKSAIQDSKNANYIVAETKWREKNIKEAFWFDKEIIKAEFKIKEFDDCENCRCNVNKYYQINNDCGIVLYAPTFRKDGNLKCYNINYDELLIKLKEKYKKNYKFIVRLHPNVAHNNKMLTYTDNVLNGSEYPLVYELIAAADIIISDYSGVIFDGYRANKVVWLYANDLENYVNTDRPLYFNFSELPSPLTQNNDELLSLVDKFDESEYEEKRKAFVDEIHYFDNDAAKLISDIILASL